MGRNGRRALALADGSCVEVREIAPGDAEALRQLVGRSSERSRYLRFFGPIKELSKEQARRFADVDGTRRYALVAVDPAAGDEVVAVVRYELEENTGGAAEYAALVEDRMQHKGLGLVLTLQLVEDAQKRGITSLHAYVLPENTSMLHLLQKLGLPERQTHEYGMERIEILLAPEAA
jgi:RimJ/RimL family protein N-acetyltransferase